MKVEELIPEINKLSSDLSDNYCVINRSLLELDKVEAMG